MTQDELNQLIVAAMRKYDISSPEEKAAMWREQAASWVRGEMAFGSDADEADYRWKNREPKS